MHNFDTNKNSNCYCYFVALFMHVRTHFLSGLGQAFAGAWEYRTDETKHYFIL